MTAPSLEIALEAQGALPNFRYDIIQPLVQGRVTVEGATLTIAGATVSAGYFDNPKFKEGDFDLLDTNWGDVVPAIDAGWDLLCLPLFIKRKPVYNYLWVRADRGRRLSVERFDGRPVVESDVLHLLVEAGFLAGPKRAVLRP